MEVKSLTTRHGVPQFDIAACPGFQHLMASPSTARVSRRLIVWLNFGKKCTPARSIKVRQQLNCMYRASKSRYRTIAAAITARRPIFDKEK
ncbi:MAG: hypothetical protein WBN40_05505 [Pseudomonadales bacterium]